MVPPPRPSWVEVARRSKRRPMGEQALSSGLIDSKTAEAFRTGSAGPAVVSVVKAALARSREAATVGKEVRPSDSSRAEWTSRKYPASWVTPCWGCGQSGHFQAACPLLQRWTCSSCKSLNAFKSHRCTACLRSPPVQDEMSLDKEPEAPLVVVQESRSAGPDSVSQLQGHSSATCQRTTADAGASTTRSQADALLEVLTTEKGMTRKEAAEIFASCGIQLPLPVPTASPVRDDISALKEKVQALERRKLLHEGLQRELEGIQAKVQHSSQVLAVLEDDIRQLRHAVSLSPDSSRLEADVPATRMPETDAILLAFEHMSSVLMSPDTMQANYHRYASATSAEGRQPLEQFPWIAQETSAALQSGTEAFAMLKAAVAQHDAVDTRGRPRKTPRTSEGYSAAAPEGSSSLI